MTRLVADSTNPHDIPAGYERLGYCDGLYGPNRPNPDTTEGWNETDLASCLAEIATQPGGSRGQIVDVERYDITPQQAPDEVQRRRAAGIDPTVYMSANAWAAVRQAFQAAGAPEPHYLVADYDGVAVIPAGAIGKQYANSPLTGGHYDLSTVATYWPGIDPPREDDVIEFVVPAGKRKAIGGPAPGFYSQYNIVCADDVASDPVTGLATSGVAVVHIYTYDYANAGAPLGSIGVQCDGNHPGVRGPIEQAGSLTSIGAVTGPFTVLFINDGPSDVTVSLH